MEPSCRVCCRGREETGEKKTDIEEKEQMRRPTHLRQESVCYRLEKEAIKVTFIASLFYILIIIQDLITG